MAVARGATIDLNHVVSFLRVVDAGSFTAAAKGLGVPTSTVSRQVAQLEEALGVRLLQRTSRRVQLTEAGTAYHERASPALGALEGAADEVRDRQETPRGVVRLTAPGDIGALLADVLVAFSEQHPGIQVELVLTGRIVDLVAEGVDLALRAGVIRDGTLVARKLGADQMLLAASAAYLERRGTPAALAELAQHDCLGFRTQRGRALWQLVGPAGPVSLEVDCRFAADDFTFLRALLLADAGVGLVPHVAVARELAEGTLRRVLPDHSQPLVGLSLVYPSAKHLPRRVVLLRDFLFQALGAQAWLRPPAGPAAASGER